LKSIITTGVKFLSSDHHLYLCIKKNKVVGFLKVGIKKLFVVDLFNGLVEIEPLCLLDFYVHESEQRSGFGKVKITLTITNLLLT